MEQQWTIGDEALSLAPVSKIPTGQLTVMARLAVKYELAPRTIALYRGIAQQWPHARRRYDLPFSVHAAFRGFDDRFELIHAKDWTVKEARLLQSERAAATKGGAP